MSVFHCNFGLTTTFPNVVLLRFSAYIRVQVLNTMPKSYVLFAPILTEDNPEFLKYVGRDFKNFGLKFNIALCNAFALRVPFSRKKADRAIELALAEWNKKTPNQKTRLVQRTPCNTETHQWTPSAGRIR